MYGGRGRRAGKGLVSEKEARPRLLFRRDAARKPAAACERAGKGLAAGDADRFAENSSQTNKMRKMFMSDEQNGVFVLDR